MKKNWIAIGMAALLVSVGTLSTGCFGSFKLTHKIYDFNKSVGNKFVQTIVMYAFAIVPVYSIGSFLDIVLFNLLEFWTGANPLAMQAGQTETQIVSKNGKTYQITATQNKFEIAELINGKLGEVSAMVFNPAEASWSAVAKGKTIKLVDYNEATNMVNMYKPDGSVISVEAKEIASVAEVKALVEAREYALAK